MNILKYFFRLVRIRLLLKTSRRRLVAAIIFLIIFSSLFLLFFYTILIYYLNYCCFNSSNIIVSLTSTRLRFQYELPITIHSLLTQTTLPKQIHIYLSPTDMIMNQKNLTIGHLRKYIVRIDPSIIIGKLFDRLVHIRFEKQDYGPATKYLPIIKAYHLMTTNTSKTQAIMICDDDHYYHPHTISTLITYSDKYKNSIVGLRGWRIRDDLTWGVSGTEEFSYHVIDSYRISEIYRVGIVTANNGYVIRPSFFDSDIYLDFNNAPADIRRVDDIWLNGYASKRNITRFVIPACCSSIGVTQTHELENYLITHQMSRGSANDHALKWFNRTWEKDLWYKFNGVNHPKYLNWPTKIYRKWISGIFRVKFIFYFGFI